MLWPITQCQVIQSGALLLNVILSTGAAGQTARSITASSAQQI